MYIPSAVRDILNTLTQAGHSAYMVGGCVRDFLIDRRSHDWDMTTSARPDEMLRIFAGKKVIPTGIRHGTVTVLADDIPVEVTTYRVDGGYEDHRHPSQVSFTRSLTDDLARRDFTMNAMAYHPEEGLIDPFGGQADLRARLIRCVGDPDTRFREDALRIIRALRFSSMLGCSIEFRTQTALRRGAPLLKTISPERLYREWQSLLCGDGVEPVFLDYADVLAVLLPEIAAMRTCPQQHPCHMYDVYTHTVKSLSAAPADLLTRLSLLFHDAGKPSCRTRGTDGWDHFYGHAAQSASIANQWLQAMRADRATVDTVTRLVSLHDADLPATRPAIRRWLGRLGADNCRRWLDIRRADIEALAPEVRPGKMVALKELSSLFDEVCREQECFSRRHLAINGRDLMAAGIPPGKDMGQLLTQMLEAVMDERLPNEREALLAWAAKAAKL